MDYFSFVFSIFRCREDRGRLFPGASIPLVSEERRGGEKRETPVVPRSRVFPLVSVSKKKTKQTINSISSLYLSQFIQRHTHVSLPAVSLASPPPCPAVALEWKRTEAEVLVEREEQERGDHDSGAITLRLLLLLMPPPLLIPRSTTPAWLPPELELEQQLEELDVLAERPLARRAARSSRRWSERDDDERGIVNFLRGM